MTGHFSGCMVNASEGDADMLQIVVVGVVALGIYLYMRSTRLAKEKWLKKLDLPGLWHWHEGEATLTLTGGYERGRFVAREVEKVIEGEWRLSGHKLVLQAPGYRQSLDVTLYQAGSIGLEDETGIRRAYTKESSNVVPLKK